MAATEDDGPEDVIVDQGIDLRPHHEAMVCELARLIPPAHKERARTPVAVQIAKMVREVTDAFGDDTEDLGSALALLAWDRKVQVDPERGIEHGLVNLALAGSTSTRGGRLNFEVRKALANLKGVAASDMIAAVEAGGGLDRLSRAAQASAKAKAARKAASDNKKRRTKKNLGRNG